MSLTESITDVVDAANKLTSVVSNKIGEIDSRVDVAVNEFQKMMVQARLENAIFRQSRNQFGNITGTDLDFYTKNDKYTINISLYREIISGIKWEDRDIEEIDVLTSMGLSGQQHFQPRIRIIKMEWSGYQPNSHSAHSIYPSPICNMSGAVTVASYAKLVAGSITGWWLQDVNEKWGVCGTNILGGPGRYIHAHPYVNTSSGEVLFIWPAVVSGIVPIRRDNPKWGYWPSMYGENPYDAAPGS
ncbi:hypothetical protein [Zooshikella sp. RANM57]|uniref:hypothetical protein n=1 Tax=Zooshikella sp. RANM57 TaxID=3425863 RepID=UPI003D6F5FDD